MVVHESAGVTSELGEQLRSAVERVSAWMAEFGPYEAHQTMRIDGARFDAALDDLIWRLRDNYPFFHPRYAGQMLKPPHPAAMVGYVATMLINPNNHALDGGPATARMEKEVVAQLAQMFGYGTEFLGHLTSNGTIANLEALFVARETHPGKGIAFSAEAHYTHGRMCYLLGVDGYPIATNERGQMDLSALENRLRGGLIGTVVLTAGTTGLGAIDPIHEALDLCKEYDVRIHVDAAYGGFFRLIADDAADGVPVAPYQAIASCDSVVVDPHKHGLQPYGCGAVLFADPDTVRHYQHDSPYTYFTSDEVHLGEISLECSRSGASAAALWLTFQLLPPTTDGLGGVLRPGRRAALAWAELIEQSTELALYQQPELDIVTYLPRTDRLSEVDRVSGRVLAMGMELPPDEAIFVATYDVTAEALARRHLGIEPDVDHARILRSVLMKPESDAWVDSLHATVEHLVGEA
jgi:glutamate/tyrosine decarboxylase-like PLP-dependent enzyme